MSQVTPAHQFFMAYRIAVTALRSLRPTSALGKAGWMWLLLGVALIWLFSPGLFQSEIPAFRDAYYFYYPQAVWLDRCAEQGDLFPVWNYAEGLGGSVAGQPSAALYYPLRIAWLVPGLTVAQRFSLFIIAHLLIAAAGMRYAAAKLKLSQQAGWLAAVSFCLSCPVFFQHNNPIYLYSAAWIGWATGALLHAVRQNSLDRRELLVFAVACSLMLLAGDPHTAVNTFIVGTCVQVATVIAAGRGGKPVRWQWRLAWPRAVVGSQWLLYAGLLLTLLTAVQWIPAWRQAQASARISQAGSAGAELSTGGERSLEHGLNKVHAIVQEGTPPVHRVYAFSLAPWYLFTAFWPTLGGSYLPQNSRLFAVLPGEGRMWVPALYFGCLPCLLVLSGLTKRKSQLTKLLLGVAALALLAALGSYSPVWIIREILTAVGLRTFANHLPADSTSGLYWLLCTILPAYDLFRYPAKWSVWLVAACSLLAAIRLSQHDPRTSSLVSKRLKTGAQLVSVTVLIAVLAIGIWTILGPGNPTGIDRWLATAAPDAWLGPPTAWAIGRSLLVAFAVPLLVVSISIGKRFYALATLVEMTWVASCWVTFVPPPAVGDKLAVPLIQREGEDVFVWIDRSQVDLLGDRPQTVSSTNRPQFAQAQADYQQALWLGKLSSVAEIRCLSAAQSIEANSLVKLRTWLSRHDSMTPLQPELDSVLRELGVTHRLTRQRFAGAETQFVWQAIDKPRPQCEFLAGDVAANRVESSRIASNSNVGRLAWQWPTSDVLEVVVPDGSAGQLLIRQLNDGGWLARAADGTRLAIEPQNLFIWIAVHGDEGSVRLTRKWLW